MRLVSAARYDLLLDAFLSVLWSGSLYVARLVFLGNHAPLAADVNLIAQIVVLLLMTAGFYFVKAAKLEVHGRFMKSAIVLQFGALILWMGPSLILNVGAFGAFGYGPLVAVAHVLFGAFALFLAVNAASHKSLISSELRWTMWATFTVWGLAAVFGIVFYLHYYVL